MSKMSAQKRAVILMIICGIMWSIGGIFIKLIPWNPFVIAGWRSLFSAACMALYMRYSKLRFQLNRYSLISGIALMAGFISFVVANKLTTAANAIVLQFTNPVFILLLSAFVLHQRISRSDIVVVTLTMAGISLFFFDQISPGGMFGNCLSLFGGFVIAIMFVSTGAADEESRMSGILLGHIFTAIIGIPMTLFFDTPLSTISIASILILGIVQLGIPYVLYGLAVKHCTPLMCSLISAIEPLLNPVWVFLFTGERPGVFALCGGAVVIVTITLWCVRRASVTMINE